jgi:hypothetical protein
MNSEKLTMMVIVAAFAFIAVWVCGCQSDAQTGALIGGATGAGIGQLAGRDTKSTLIGAAVGSGAGYMIGNEADKKKTKAETENIRQEMNTVTVNVTNSNGSVTPVTLRKQGVEYVGPKSEYYNSLPTSEQLRQAGYGF